MKKQKQHSILISGGGTGGHIFPAIAIAQEIQALRPDLYIHFVGALGKMEMEKVPGAGYPISGLPVSAFHRRLTLRNLSFPARLLVSLVKASRIIKKFNPLLVIGTGGFASGPLMRAATRAGIPVLIQEQNAFPGVTNRLMAKKAVRICVAHDGLDQWFPQEVILKTGNPVRKDLINIEHKRNEAISFFKLDPERPVVLVMGGSLGALSLNQAVLANLKELSGAKIQLIWQTGTAWFEQARSAVDDLKGDHIHPYPFLERMDLAYAAADVVVCRAGAITLSELALAAKPCILIPYPSAAGNHQMKNALSYKNHRAALIIENQNVDKELMPLLTAVLKNHDLREEMSRNLASLAMPEAGKRIASEALKIIERRMDHAS